MTRRAGLTIRFAAVVLLCAQPVVSAVAVESRATAGTTTLVTGRWSVAPVPTSISPNPGTGLLVNSLSTKKNSYFWVRNYGTYDLTSFTIGQNVSATGRSPTVEIRACTGAWDTTRDTCSGTIVVLLSTPDGQAGAALVPMPLAVGAGVELAAYPTKNGMTTTISASVDRTSIRAALIRSG